MPAVKNQTLKTLRKEKAAKRRDHILEQYRLGKPVTEIAKELGLSRVSVYAIIKEPQK